MKTSTDKLKLMKSKFKSFDLRNCDIGKSNIDNPGLYMFCLKKNAEKFIIKELRDLLNNKPQYLNGNILLYIGKAEESLYKRDIRDHILGKRTSRWSTFRRSMAVALGFPLKNAKKGSTKKTVNFKKMNGDNKIREAIMCEDTFSEWLKKNILMYFIVFSDKKTLKSNKRKLSILKECEIDMIRKYDPPFNIKDAMKKNAMKKDAMKKDAMKKDAMKDEPANNEFRRKLRSLKK